jgi:UDP-3-O-[3-hydroxymyristoyl] glucosamine N-acyltransferase
MSSEWMKVMLEEISRKKAEAEQARVEEQVRLEERAPVEEKARIGEQAPVEEKTRIEGRAPTEQRARIETRRGRNDDSAQG